MKYLPTFIFLVFLISNFYILRMNRKATTKRKAFHWWMAVFAIFMVLYCSITITDKILLVVVLPVLAAVVFGWLRFTKFCDWCGRMIQTNLPFRKGNACPRCGSEIS
jgi:hypothetical protein